MLGMVNISLLQYEITIIAEYDSLNYPYPALVCTANISWFKHLIPQSILQLRSLINATFHKLN